MFSSPAALLSAIVFLPTLGALLLAFFPKEKDDLVRYVTLAVTLLVLLGVVLFIMVPGGPANFDTATAEMQSTFSIAWIPSFNINYAMGMDGISFPLLLLTAFVSVLAMGASWSIKKHVKAYCILFLLLETGMLGVFLALDFFLFYVFWEVMLLPMYFLIGVWGGPRREYAAIKFFLYTLLGSVMMLIAILMLYFNSDLRKLARATDFFENPASFNRYQVSETEYAALGLGKSTSGEDRIGARVNFARVTDGQVNINFVTDADGEAASAIYDAESGSLNILLPAEHQTAADVVAAISANPLASNLFQSVSLAEGSDGSGKVLAEDSLTVGSNDPIHTFNILALAGLGQKTDAFHGKILGWSIQRWAFLLLFIGFAIKVPSVPVHTWLPDAHVEAPTPISMILAGVLLKMGGYGIIRICYPICPIGGYELSYLVCTLGVISMIYGAFAAMAQTDFKRLVAYSSVSHMGYVVLGLGVWSATADIGYNADYWNMGIKGAMFQMIGHGVSSAGMFFMVGVIYDRVHHRDLNKFGGLFSRMPLYTALAIGIFFAGLGLPGLCGFIGEVFVVLSVWQFDKILAVLSASVVVLTAAYILWALQRVYLGAEYHGPHEEELKPINGREMSIAGILLSMAILLGIFPHQTILVYMDATIDRQTQELADWTRDQYDAKISPIQTELPQEKQQKESQQNQAEEVSENENQTEQLSLLEQPANKESTSLTLSQR